MENEKMSELKQRTLAEAELLRNGAEYNENGVPMVTEEQRKIAEQEMETELLAENLLKNFDLTEIGILVKALVSYSGTKFAESSAGENAKRTITSLLERLNGIEQVAGKIKIAESAQQTTEKPELEK